MKKLCALSLCVVLIISLSGCGLRNREKEAVGGMDGANDVAGHISSQTQSEESVLQSIESEISSQSQVTSKPVTITPAKKTFKPVTDPRELVEIYDFYTPWGICCEHEEVDLSQVERYLTEDQKQFVCTAIKISCCKTKEEVKAHNAHYMGDLIRYNDDSNNYIELNDGLYYVMGGLGICFHDYDNMQVKTLPNGDVEIIADYLNSGGEYMEKNRFTIKKKNGSFYIHDVKTFN